MRIVIDGGLPARVGDFGEARTDDAFHVPAAHATAVRSLGVATVEQLYDWTQTDPARVCDVFGWTAADLAHACAELRGVLATARPGYLERAVAPKERFAFGALPPTEVKARR